MDLAGWLQQQGLTQLERTLRAAGIDLDVLGDLDSADLAEIGLNLGDRKRLLKAITSAPPVAAPGEAQQPAEVNVRTAPAAAERRQLTVMFCDLVGSTALSAKLDPEDLRALTGDYHNAVSRAVVPYDGHVAQFLGDGVLVYFGYPLAHEDDAVRAVRAALAIMEVVAQIKALGESSLQTRIGIATGPVVVGQIGGGSPAAELSAIGETPNLAARLQALAQPGEIIIAPETRRLIGASFELISTGPQLLKGIDKPVAPWRVVGERTVYSRFEAEHAHELTQFIGRDGELSTLLERWSTARDGEGQVVLLSGEAGIGKSRISETLSERLKQEPSTLLLWQCSPYFVSSALYPVVQQLERAAGIVPADALEGRSSKLVQALQPTDLGHESTGYLLRLLGLPDGGRVPSGEAPEQQKANTLKALIDGVEGLARQQPVLLLLEDAHWIDPTTEELLGQAIERLRDSRVLILVTSRPEYCASWGNPTNLTRLPLSRLGHRHCTALIDSVSMGKTLPELVVAEIVRKTDGIPLFVEELTKTVIESGLLSRTEAGFKLEGPLSALAIPSTLQDSLMARLDRLVHAKEVAQVGATFGREFTRGLLASALPMAPERLTEALDELVKSELVFRRGTLPEATYTFKHALVRDTAYTSMVKSQRTHWHSQIAQAIEQHEPKKVAAQPELLAYHHQEAGHLDTAIGYWINAGDRAAGQSNGAEATAHFDAALKLLATKAESRSRSEDELEIRRKQGYALVISAGPASRGFEANAGRALDLALELGRLDDYVAMCVDDAGAKFCSGRNRSAIERIAALDPEQVAVLSPRSRVSMATLLGTAHGLFGDLDESWRYFSEAMAIDDASPVTHVHPYVGTDPAIFTRSFVTKLRAIQGHLDQSRAIALEGFRLADQRAHVPSILKAKTSLVYSLVLSGAYGEAVEHAESMLSLAQRFGVRPRIAEALQSIGQATIALGDVTKGHELIRKGLDLWVSTNGPYFSTEYGLQAADLMLRAGDVIQAKQFLDAASAMQESTDEQYCDAELRRLHGRLMALDGAVADAEVHYRGALKVADRQGAKLFSLRAATDLATLLLDQGRDEEASAVLKPVYRWFKEGLDYPDLRRAEALLSAITDGYRSH